MRHLKNLEKNCEMKERTLNTSQRIIMQQSFDFCRRDSNIFRSAQATLDASEIEFSKVISDQDLTEVDVELLIPEIQMIECNSCQVILNEDTIEKNSKPKAKKNFHCQFCYKNFRSSSHKKRHEMIHTGERPFTCRFCLQRFRNNQKKNTHERIHTKEKPFKCQFCEKCFTDKSNKIQHEKTHRPNIACQYCGAKFARKSSKEIHEKTVCRQIVIDA